MQTTATRVIEINEDKCVDKNMTYDEYIEWKAKNNKK
jgi:hypothetical protein